MLIFSVSLQHSRRIPFEAGRHASYTLLYLYILHPTILLQKTQAAELICSLGRTGQLKAFQAGARREPRPAVGVRDMERVLVAHGARFRHVLLGLQDVFKGFRLRSNTEA